MVHKDLAQPLGDLTGTGDQSSGEVALVTSGVHVKETTSTEPEQQEEDATGCSQDGQIGYQNIKTVVKTGIVKVHILL